MFSKTLTTFAALLATTLALPNITIKALPAGCSSYPGYDASSDTAGPWSASLANSDNAQLEVFGDSTVYSVSYTPATGPVMRWGRVRTPSPSLLPSMKRKLCSPWDEC